MLFLPANFLPLPATETPPARIKVLIWHGAGPGKSQHDPRGPFTVRIVDKERAVTRGLADFETDDELYTCLDGDAPIPLLAQGRAFLTTVGHYVKAFTNACVPHPLRQGCAWTAGAPTR